ncbi:MAG TPA: sulfatase [Candidatus Polarisedimenticolia bacterium]|nr:sulfatase [Candidatus Polarisedimenticolia bacterium]
MRRRVAPLLLSGLVLGLAFACRGSVSGPHPNVLLITVDTLRPDHLSCLGYARPTSPSIDTLAARGVVFRQAVTAAGRTVQSFPSILTGVIPPTHGLREEGQSTEAIAGRMTLTHALKEAGYDAFAVTQGLNVGLHRDFDVYDPSIYLDPQGNKVVVPTRNDMEATKKALQWLRGRRGRQNPFFLWLRYNAPHWPYDPPAPYTEKFDPDYHGAHTFNDEAAPGVERGDLIFGLKRLPEREIEHAIAHYDGEVAYADAAIGELLRGIEALGATGRTIVVLTADHGESLGEHDYFFEHGAYLYEPVVRVPLIVVAPGRLPAGAKVEALGSTIDILPTVLDLAGIRIPEGIEGVSLVPWARGETSKPAPPAYSESGRNFYPMNPRQKVSGVAGKWRMMRDDRYKLLMIPDVPGPQWEFYDLAADPGEKTNVLAQHPAEADRLKRLLLEVIARDPMRNDRDETALPDDLIEKLKSLGYVGGGSPK